MTIIKDVKISVVIPAYNEESFLSRLLTSISCQTYRPYEIIVVNNNSSDNTKKIARSFRGVRVITEKNRGYAYACNKGFGMAKGDIVARADADYVLPKNWLQKIHKAFQKDKELIAIGGPLYPLESAWWENIIYFPALPIWMNILKALHRGFLFPNMAVRKYAYRACDGFDTNLKFGEDTDFCMRLVKIGKVKLQTNLYVYTSTRRLRQLGFLKTLFGYSIWNQISMWLGKKVTIGTEPVREMPKQNPNPHHPWIYLWLSPSIAVCLLFIFVAQFSTPSVLVKTYSTKIKLESIQITKAIKKPVAFLKKTIRTQYFLLQPSKTT